MANIVLPVRASLLLQVLLEMEIYMTSVWAVTYLVYIILNVCASQLCYIVTYLIFQLIH